MRNTIDLFKTGQKLKNLLELSGYDVKFIQSYLHLSCPQSIYRWYKGQALPSLEHFYALSRLLDVHMEELFVFQKESLLGSVISTAKEPQLKRVYYYAMYFKRIA